MSTKDVFLSYGREPEVTQFVVQLKCDLESHGVGVWLDTDDIPAGSDWHGAIGKGLHNCRALVAVITKKYINSRFCSSELYTADGDRKLIFPVIYEDVDFGASDTGMGVKYVISGINWSMFRPRIDDYVASLYKLIEGLREKGIISCLCKDSSYLYEQLLQMHGSPRRTHSSSGLNFPPSLQVTPYLTLQATPSLSLKGGTVTFPCPPSPPPMYSDVFPAGPLSTVDVSGSSSASTDQEDMNCRKVMMPTSAMFEPTLTGLCAATTPLPDATTCPEAMIDCNWTKGSVMPWVGPATGKVCSALASGLTDTSTSRSQDGQRGPSIPEVGGERRGTEVVGQPSLAGSGVATAAASGVAVEPSPPIDRIGASFPAEITGTANVGIAPVPLVTLGIPQSLPALTSNTSPSDTSGMGSPEISNTRSPDNSNISPPDNSNISSPDTFNAHISVTIIEGEKQDGTSMKSSPDNSNERSPDSSSRSQPNSSAAHGAAAISPHVSHLSFMKRPISHMIKLERHLRGRLHQRLHPRTPKELAMLDGEEEEEEEEKGEEEEHVAGEGVASSVGSMCEPSSSLLGHGTSEPRDAADSAPRSSPGNLLPLPLPQMHLKGLRLRLANRLLKGALLPPTQQDVRVSPKLDPTDHR